MSLPGLCCTCKCMSYTAVISHTSLRADYMIGPCALQEPKEHAVIQLLRKILKILKILPRPVRNPRSKCPQQVEAFQTGYAETPLCDGPQVHVYHNLKLLRSYAGDAIEAPQEQQYPMCIAIASLVTQTRSGCLSQQV